MARPLLRIVFCGLAVLMVISGCGKNWEEFRTIGLEEPRTELESLPIAQVIAAQEGWQNTFDVFEGDNHTGRIADTVIPWDMETATWRNYESGGTYVEFRLIPGAGYAVTQIHNPRNQATIIFDEPLVFVPLEMVLGQPHTSHATFEGWARGWSRRRGTATITTEYMGLQDVTVPIGRLEDCARVDATIAIRLPLGLSLTMNHRQWLHPGVGVVIRDVEGRLSWVGLGVRTFRRRMELTATEPLDEERRQEMVGR